MFTGWSVRLKIHQTIAIQIFYAFFKLIHYFWTSANKIEIIFCLYMCILMGKFFAFFEIFQDSWNSWVTHAKMVKSTLLYLNTVGQTQ